MGVVCSISVYRGPLIGAGEITQKDVPCNHEDLSSTPQAHRKEKLGIEVHGEAIIS